MAKTERSRGFTFPGGFYLIVRAWRRFDGKEHLRAFLGRGRIGKGGSEPDIGPDWRRSYQGQGGWIQAHSDGYRRP
jgi:hypothetical protein